MISSAKGAKIFEKGDFLAPFVENFFCHFNIKLEKFYCAEDDVWETWKI
jgi:hypothetical protein